MKRRFRDLYPCSLNMTFDEYLYEVNSFTNTTDLVAGFEDDIRDCFEFGLTPEECFLELCS